MLVSIKATHHIIFIPGLGDTSRMMGRSEADLFMLWRVYGVKTHYFPISWEDEEAFESKLDRLVKVIDDYAKPGNLVSLVGASAGAGAAINAYSRRKEVIHKVVCVCGKLQNPQTVSQLRFKQSPAFKDSLELLSASYEKLNEKDLAKILSLRPLTDMVVPLRDTIIPGAKNEIMFSFGHAVSIIYALSIGSFRIVRYIKS